MLTVYGIPNCDTIKKTRAWLDAAGIEYRFHDYKKAGCPLALAKRFLQHLGHDELINTRGTTWRKLPEVTRTAVDAKTAAKLMSEYPSLIRRPLIEAEAGWLAGFDEERLRSLASRA